MNLVDLSCSACKGAYTEICIVQIAIDRSIDPSLSVKPGRLDDAFKSGWRPSEQHHSLNDSRTEKTSILDVQIRDRSFCKRRGTPTRVRHQKRETHPSTDDTISPNVRARCWSVEVTVVALRHVEEGLPIRTSWSCSCWGWTCPITKRVKVSRRCDLWDSEFLRLVFLIKSDQDDVQEAMVGYVMFARFLSFLGRQHFLSHRKSFGGGKTRACQKGEERIARWVWCFFKNRIEITTIAFLLVR